MVLRLFVPRGEGQYPTNTRPPEPLPAENYHYRLWQGSKLAAFVTCALSLAGRNGPGTFIRNVAYCNILTLGWHTAFQVPYREIQKKLYKREGIVEKPGKLWEKCERYTMDDAALIGGTAGLLVALCARRSFPGVLGWKRYFGAATLATGGTVHGVFYLWQKQTEESKQVLSIYRNTHIHQSDAYNLLAHDEEFKATLSLPARLLLVSFHGGENATLQQPPPVKETQDIAITIAQLNGPDVKKGYREYKENPISTGALAFQEHIADLSGIERQHAIELEYVWQEMARKEYDFYQMLPENGETDIVRRELQLLSEISLQFSMQTAFFQWHIADAQKRLDQLRHLEAGHQKPLDPAPLADHGLQPEWKHKHNPHLVLAFVRSHWENLKEVLGLLEQMVEMSHPGLAKVGYTENTIPDIRKNLEATERLLKQFEEQATRAEAS